MRRAGTVAALVILGLAFAGARAGAHAVLVRSSPSDGALLLEAPRKLVLTFTEAPDSGLSEIRIIDSAGSRVETGDPETVPDRPGELRLHLPELPEGVYTVSYRALSRVDGHLTSGAFTFGVGVEAAPIGDTGHGAEGEHGLSGLAVAGRWAFYWGLALLLAGSVAGLFVFRRPIRGGGVLLGIAWATALLGLGWMFVAERSGAGVSAVDLLSSDRGRLLIARGAALLPAGVAAALVAVRRDRDALATLGAAAAVAMLVHAYVGHAGASASWLWFRVGTQWIHLLAVGTWVGGLGWLLLGMWRGLAEDRDRSVKRFSRLAGYAVLGVAVTGVLRAVDSVGSVGRLFGNGFGTFVILKTALFVGLIAFGAINRYRIIPALSSGARRLWTLRRTVTSEVLIAVGVFGISGIMAELVPPDVAAAATVAPQQEQRVLVNGSDFATTVRVRLVVTPGVPGPNRFDVTIEDFDTAEPVPARAVTLRFSLPDRPDLGESILGLEPHHEGLWKGTGTAISVEGTWRVAVLIEREADSVEVALDVSTRAPDHPGDSETHEKAR